MKHALVTTTINVPTLLEDYCADFRKHGRDDVQVIIAGDKKTPIETLEFCRDLQKRSGVPITYLAPAIQEAFLSCWINYKNFLPWNCIQRRNVAILAAYHDGADIIYTIDDDNFLYTPDYIGVHTRALGHGGNIVVKHESGWFNPIPWGLDESFYPRGFSFKNRRLPVYPAEATHRETRSVVNAGLWLGEPDIDAVTRMAIAPWVDEVDRSFVFKPLVLGHGTKCPFNSQNTALHRDVIPAYCLATGLGRYDDIMASYIVKRIADHLGDYISFGMPFVMQRRNPHDVWQDFEEERIGMQIVDDFVAWIYAVNLTGTSYRACCAELITALSTRTGTLSGEKRAFMASLCRNYELWLEIFT